MPSIRATASWPRTPSSPRRWRPPGWPGSGRPRRPSRPWATRRRPGVWPCVSACPPSPATTSRHRTIAALIAAARRIGFPLLVKPAGGGGGKGMRIVRSDGRAGRCPGRQPARGAHRLRRRSAHPRAPAGPARATSRSRSCSTPTATVSSSASATAAPSGASRRSSRRRPVRRWTHKRRAALGEAALRVAGAAGYVGRRDGRVPADR